MRWTWVKTKARLFEMVARTVYEVHANGRKSRSEEPRRGLGLRMVPSPPVEDFGEVFKLPQVLH